VSLKQRICKLIDVKSIVTFSLTAVLVYLAVRDKIEPETFINIYLPVISFYFGIQYQKNTKE
jgi:Na+-transporting methylmalonyl-CoA/oxaloacetate decarboxylase beta subunit